MSSDNLGTGVDAAESGKCWADSKDTQGDHPIYAAAGTSIGLAVTCIGLLLALVVVGTVIAACAFALNDLIREDRIPTHNKAVQLKQQKKLEQLKKGVEVLQIYPTTPIDVDMKKVVYIRSIQNPTKEDTVTVPGDFSTEVGAKWLLGLNQYNEFYFMERLP